MINWWPPCIIVYTDKLPAGVGGDIRGLVVRLRPKYEGDLGLLHHELTHVWQFEIPIVIGAVIAALLFHFGYQQAAPFALAIGIAAHPVLYKFVRAYRQWAEVTASVVQRYWPRMDGTYLSLDDAAYRLTDERYKLGLTLSEARELLKG